METSPNAEHITFWNEVLADQFDRFRPIFVEANDAHSRGPLTRLGLRPGMRAIDVGCGYGETTLQMARLVGREGHVRGTDCCEPFLEVARRDAAAAGLDNVTFEATDAQSCSFEPEFDVAFARFGTMFFQNPTAGMRNIATALAPGGRLLMIVWRVIEDNEWMAVPKEVAARHLPPAPDDAPNCGPGPFSMANPETVAAILTAAGYVDIAFERVDAVVRAGATLEDTIAFQLAVGPAAELVREASSDEMRPAIEQELRAALSPFARDDGVWMSTSSWAVTASRAA